MQLDVRATLRCHYFCAPDASMVPEWGGRVSITLYNAAVVDSAMIIGN